MSFLFGTLGFKFLDHPKHPPALPAQPVDPPDLLTWSQALNELSGLEFAQGTAGVREIELELFRELGRCLGGLEGEEHACGSSRG